MLYENEERFAVRLSLASASSGASVTVQPDVATVRILDTNSELCVCVKYNYAYIKSCFV